MGIQTDIFSDPQPKTLWVVICGQPDSEGNVSILKDTFPGEGAFHLTFSSREAAEREAKAMNKIRAGMKLTEIYAAAKVKPGWLDGLSTKRVG
jgi:hypothetical protein